MPHNLNWIYWGISQILLFWHKAIAFIFGEAADVSWVLAIVLLVLSVRVVLFPVFVKQIKSQRKMQELQPKMAALKEKYKNDRQGMQVEVTKLMQQEKANPLMGCLPIFLQIPVFLGLFHVLRQLNPTSDKAESAMIHEYGWTFDQFEHAANAKLFGAPIAASFRSSTSFLDQLGGDRMTVQIVSGILVATMVITTYVTQRQMIARSGPAAAGPQAMIQKFMLYGIPASLLVSGVIFPIGVVIYWVVQNFFSMGQQFWVLKRMPPPGGVKKEEVSAEKAKALAPKPGAKPKKDKAGRASQGDDEAAADGSSDSADVERDDKASAAAGSSNGGRKAKAKAKKRKGGRI